MTDWKRLGEVVLCLGGINPLCWTGCSEDELPQECLDDAALKNNEDVYKTCKEMVCNPVAVLERDEWHSGCGFYNFNGQCFTACEWGFLNQSYHTENYPKLYNKLCLEDGRGIRTKWTPPRLFSTPPEKGEQPDWCSTNPKVPLPPLIPSQPFQHHEKEAFVRFVTETLRWEIWTGFYDYSEKEGNRIKSGKRLETPADVIREFSWMGALPELGLHNTPTHCGLFCALMDVFNRLITDYPHLIPLLKNPVEHPFALVGGTIGGERAGTTFGVVDSNNYINSSKMVLDGDKILKRHLCAGEEMTQEAVNRSLSYAIFHELSHVFQNPPDIDNIPYFYEQMGFGYLYLFLDAAFDVYRLSPSLERGDPVFENNGGRGFVSGYDQGSRRETDGMESFADEAAFYFMHKDLFLQYAKEDAGINDYFLGEKYLFLGEQLFCDDIPPRLFGVQEEK